MTKKKHLNTRLVSIEMADEDTLLLKLYYGRQCAEQARLTEIKGAPYGIVAPIIEQFRMYGMELQDDTTGNVP